MDTANKTVTIFKYTSILVNCLKAFIWISSVVALITEYITFIEYAIKKVMIAFSFIDSL